MWYVISCQIQQYIEKIEFICYDIKSIKKAYIHVMEDRIMTIDKKLEGTKLEIILEGRLDTITAPALEKEIKQSLNGITELIFDFEKLEYISSAGLRVLLAAQKIMNKQGSMIIKNVNDVINDVFEVTGFVDILTIE